MPASNAKVLLLTLALATGTGGAHAEDAPAEPQPQAWNIRSGVEIGKDHNQGFSVSLDYSGHVESSVDDVRYWTFGASGLRTKSRNSTAGVSTEGVTTDGSIYAGYGNDRIRGHLGFDGTHEQDFRRSKQVSGGVDFSRKGFSATIEASHRRTEFVDFTVTPAAAALVGITLPTAGLAGCSITDRGVGTKLGYDGQTWSVYAGSQWNSYKKAACSFDITAVRNTDILDAIGLQRLSGRFLNRAIARSGGRLGRRSQLLKSDMNLGFSHMWRSTNLIFDYARSKDEFGEATQSGYQLTGSHPVGTNCLLDLSIGTTIANSQKSPYLALYVTVGL